MLTERQIKILEKYQIDTTKSINDILDDLNDLMTTIGFNEKLGCLNNMGDELQNLFDELFPLGEDVWI
nr:MAG TPA: hypothetical protein [Caudoviricetes sp.]